jgi:predicted ester cyclase
MIFSSRVTKEFWRGSWRATHRGDFEGIAPTGRQANWTVIIIGQFVGFC